MKNRSLVAGPIDVLRARGDKERSKRTKEKKKDRASCEAVCVRVCVR